MKIQLPNKPINVKLYVILSLIPFLGYYPFVKLKKTMKIFLINLPIGVVSFVILLFVNHFIGQLMSYVVIPTIDAFLIYMWANSYNKTFVY